MARSVVPFIKPVGKTNGAKPLLNVYHHTFIFLIARGSGAASSPPPVFFYLLLLRRDEILLIVSVSRCLNDSSPLHISASVLGCIVTPILGHLCLGASVPLCLSFSVSVSVSRCFGDSLSCSLGNYVPSRLVALASFTRCLNDSLHL